MFVGEKLLSNVYNEYFTGGINVSKLAVTLFVNQEDVPKLAIGRTSKDKVCLDRHGNGHGDHSNRKSRKALLEHLHAFENSSKLRYGCLGSIKYRVWDKQMLLF